MSSWSYEKQRGYAAYLFGLNNTSDNPYPHHTVRWYEWDDGYNEAVFDQLSNMNNQIRRKL